MICSILYQFIWGTQHEIAWRDMFLPLSKDGLGIRDYKRIQLEATIDKAGKIWANEGIWVRLINVRYVKQQALSTVEKKSGDLVTWHAFKFKQTKED